jgi:hypothetical protein
MAPPAREPERQSARARPWRVHPRDEASDEASVEHERAYDFARENQYVAA